MKVTYIHHSCFSIEYKDLVFLFDYYKGKIPDYDPKKQIYVFSSHNHHDHYNEAIFDLMSKYPNLTFIMSDDINVNLSIDLLKERKDCLYFLKANEEKLFLKGQALSHSPKPLAQNILQVRTLDSTDEGVAFCLSFYDKTIFHSGDLHWWTWKGETRTEYEDMTKRFFKEVNKLKNIPIDLAFLPLDPRQEERFYLGFDYYLKTCNIKYVFPMHFWGDYSVIAKLKAMDIAKDYREKIMDMEKEGQVFQLK